MPHTKRPQPPDTTAPSFPDFARQAAALDFDSVVLVMKNSRTGAFVLRSNITTEDAIVTMEDISNNLLDEMAKANGPLVSSQPGARPSS